MRILRLGWRERGTMLITAMIVVFVVIGLTGAILFPSTSRLQGIETELAALRAEFAAATAVSAAMNQLNQFVFGNFQSADSPATLQFERYDSLGGNLTPGDQASYYALVEDLTGLKEKWQVIGVGSYHGITRAQTVFVRRAWLSIYDNAVVGGEGARGAVINGNVSLAGGMVVFGEAPDGTGDAAPTDVVVSFGGTGGIDDDWSAMDATLYAKLPTWPFDPKYPLKSEVRVKNGQVDLSGTGSIGGGSNPVELFYGGNVGGNSGATNLHAHKTGAYDLTDAYTFPDPSEPYIDKATATEYASYFAFLSATAFDLSAVFDIAAHRQAGGATNKQAIDSSTPSFSRTDPINPDNSITWNKATMTLTINGLIKYGSLTLGTNQDTILYEGRATIWLEDPTGDGDLTVHGDLLPKTRFPMVDVLGLAAADDIFIATGGGDAGMRLAAVFYAADTVTCRKQSQIAGTLFGNYFDLGGQVPKVFAVPQLKDYPPPGFLVDGRVPMGVFRLSFLNGLPSDKRFDPADNTRVIDR